MQKATLLAGLQASPGDPLFLEALGSILEADEAWEEVLEQFQTQLPALPDGTPIAAYAHYMLGKAAVELGQMDKALVWLERSAEIKPDFPYTHHLVARCYLNRGQLQKALAAFDRCSAIVPEFPWSWLGRGEVELLMGHADQALVSLRKALGYQQHQQGDHLQPFIDAIHKAGANLNKQRRRSMAAELWPDRPPLDDDQQLAPLDELQLCLHRFRWVLDQAEADQ